MTRKRRGLLAFLLVPWLAMVLACGGGGNRSEPEAAENTIPYEVLKKVQRGDGNLILELLVSEAASKQEIMQLAESLRREYAGKYAFINIFDSRVAWQRRDDESYPQKEFEKHWLLQIGGPVPGDDPQEIHWLAKERDH